MTVTNQRSVGRNEYALATVQVKRSHASAYRPRSRQVVPDVRNGKRGTASINNLVRYPGLFPGCRNFSARGVVENQLILITDRSSPLRYQILFRAVVHGRIEPYGHGHFIVQVNRRSITRNADSVRGSVKAPPGEGQGA